MSKQSRSQWVRGHFTPLTRFKVDDNDKPVTLSDGRKATETYFACTVGDCKTTYVSAEGYTHLERHLRNHHSLEFEAKKEEDTTDVTMGLKREYVELFIDQARSYRHLLDPRRAKFVTSVASMTKDQFISMRRKVAAYHKEVNRRQLGQAYCTLCADIGTTHGCRTLAITGISRRLAKPQATTCPLHCVPVTTTKAEDLAKQLRIVISEVRTARGNAVVLVTDNGKNLIKAAQLMQGEILHARCLAHCLQLAMQEIVKTTAVTKAVEAGNRHHMRAPGKTRWWSVYVELSRTQKKVTVEALRDLVDISDGVKFLEPFVKYGRLIERDNCNLEEGLQLFYLAMKTHECCEEYIRSRAVWMVTPVQVAVAALSPYFPWERADSPTVAVAFKAVKKAVTVLGYELDEKILHLELNEFKAGRSQRSFSAPESDTSLSDFWKSPDTEENYPQLHGIQKTLRLTACTEASCERYFSAQGRVHTAARNRLSPDAVMEESIIRFRSSQAKPENAFARDIAQLGDEQPAEGATLNRLDADSALFFVEAAVKQEALNSSVGSSVKMREKEWEVTQIIDGHPHIRSLELKPATRGQKEKISTRTAEFFQLIRAGPLSEEVEEEEDYEKKPRRQRRGDC